MWGWLCGLGVRKPIVSTPRHDPFDSLDGIFRTPPTEKSKWVHKLELKAKKLFQRVQDAMERILMAVGKQRGKEESRTTNKCLQGPGK